MSQKLNVLHLFESYPLFYQPYMQLYEKRLSNQECLDLEIVTFKPSKDESVTTMPNYYLRKLKEKSYKIFNKKNRNFNYLEVYAKKKNIDIIHIQDSYLFNKVSSLTSNNLLKKPKIVLTMRGAETYTKPWVFKKWKRFYIDFEKKIDAFVVMSDNQKNYLHEKWKVSQDKINVIPISFGKKFDLEPKKPNKKSIKIVSVFRLYWVKNITDSLKLIKKIKELGFDVEYDIYGSGPDIEHIYFLRDEYNLNQEVTIKGTLENDILKAKFIDYDFIIQLSLTESLGMSVIEAQSRGLPAIVSNTGGLPEVILNNKSGFVFENFETTATKMIDLFVDETRYLEFSQKAIANSHSKFSIDIEIDKTISLYRHLVSN